MTQAERVHEDKLFKGIVIAMAVGLAIAFAWLYFQQDQRSTDNRNLIHRVAMDESALRRAVYHNCLSSNSDRRALRGLLIKVRDFQPVVPYAPDVEAASLKLFNELIGSIKYRKCVKTTTTTGG